MTNLEYFILQIIWKAALNAGIKAEHYYNDVTDEKFYNSFEKLNEYIFEYLSIE